MTTEEPTTKSTKDVDVAPSAKTIDFNAIRSRDFADFIPQEAATELKGCARTMDRWRKLYEGPPITKLGRRIFYRRLSLEAWLRDQEQGACNKVIRELRSRRSTGRAA
jgi:hypothetical protein